ncbi:hypothetical protein [Kitasatospora sp. CB01950]|uniref:hypothetical protein n=1 Tax=Kitasatospora sp. CB01950 TaxID=1703930 RepID=UPI00093C1D9E|nr:hypothetical protein [Kitasatospora sp. CB01950]OKI95075.1 hypothetical protein AMK19_32915 [Kitasatospora sp. CB01950]
MLNRLRDTVSELRGHHTLTQDINGAVASGDHDAAAVFRTGTLAAALTESGRDARGTEITEYVDRVIAADGNATRAGWLHRR